MWLPHSFIVLLLAAFVNCAITNTTVDDTSFTFAGAWTAASATSLCDICSSKPDPSLLHGGTWHDGNIRNGAVPTTGSFTFQGSAIYIFGVDQALSQPNIDFTLGSVKKTHRYTGTESFVYNALFFSATGLAVDQTHTVNWALTVTDASTVVVQAALFDYAIVTSGEVDVKPTTAPAVKPASSSQPPTSSTKATSSEHSSSDSVPSSHTSTSASVNGASQATSSHQSSSPFVSRPTPSTTSTIPYPFPLSSTVTVDGTTTVTAQSAAVHAVTTSNLGPIVGAVIGALALAALIVLFLFLRSRRVRRIRSQTDKAARSQFLRIEDYPLHSLPNSLPPADTREVQNSGPVSATASNSKTRRYLNTNLGPSTTSLLRTPPSEGTSADLPRPRLGADVESPASAGNPARDLQFLEERLATLEAQVAVQQYPPPYVHEGD